MANEPANVGTVGGPDGALVIDEQTAHRTGQAGWSGIGGDDAAVHDSIDAGGCADPHHVAFGGGEAEYAIAQQSVGPGYFADLFAIENVEAAIEGADPDSTLFVLEHGTRIVAG